MIYQGTNAPGRPSQEGEVIVFRSPYSSVLLVDRAELNKYGHLVWAAVQHDDPVAIDAIAEYLH